VKWLKTESKTWISITQFVLNPSFKLEENSGFQIVTFTSIIWGRVI
jgi:hypothetical protein